MIVVLSLASGLTGSHSSITTIQVAGLWAIFIGAIVMGVAGYFSSKAHTDKTEDSAPITDLENARVFLANLGMNEEQQEKALEEMAKDREQWKKMMLDGLQQTNHSRWSQAFRSGMSIGLSYAAGGAITLLPFFIIEQSNEGLKFSAIITLSLIFVLSWIKNKLNRLNGFWNAFLPTLMGALAAAATYGVARIFWNG